MQNGPTKQVPVPPTHCTWDCTTYGYTKINDACERDVKVGAITLADSVRVTNVGTSSNQKKVVKALTLTFDVASPSGANWYVTHNAFSPTSTSHTSSSLSTMNAWSGSSTAPTTYDLPDSDGEYTLYVFAANSIGTGIQEGTGPTVLLDRTGPEITKTSGPDDGAEIACRHNCGPLQNGSSGCWVGNH